MEFDRLAYLSLEADIINAIINNEEGVEFNKLFENDEKATLEFKLDMLCRLTQQILSSVELQDETVLLNMFNELYPNSKVGEFCIGFIKQQLDRSDCFVNEKINKLLALDINDAPEAQIKKDYLNLLLTLLLNQQPLNIELINKYNNEIKKLINK